jgi:hypothetical protein
LARDYYAETRALAAKLTDQGYAGWSEQLTDEIAAGATGTEIVMGLRWVLAQLLQNEDGLPADLRLEARGLHQGLDRLLR